MNDNDEEISRPITLYVSRISMETPDMRHLKRRRVTVIDVELTKHDAQVLAKTLMKRTENGTPGAIRIRLFGHLVI